MNEVSRHLFCFGLGYTARAVAAELAGGGWTVSGTVRESEYIDGDFSIIRFDRLTGRDLAGVTDILISIPPGGDGDPVLNTYAALIAGLPDLRWIGYLSTTGVYGNTGGEEVGENAPLRPSNDRSRNRVEAERAWREFCGGRGLPLHIFRLAGIYGPGRSAFDRLRDGTARRIDRPGHLFSRVHVADIAQILIRSQQSPEPGAIYNVADDEPVEAEKIIAEAARLLGIEPPPLIPFEDAKSQMSPMALSFWQDNRWVDNAKVKSALGITLLYPNYRAGLKAIADIVV